MAVLDLTTVFQGISFILDNLALTVALTIVLCLTLWQFREVYSRRKLPPGPTPLPLLGNMHLFIWNDFDVVLRNLARKYGDIFTVQFSHVKMIVLNSYDLNKNAMSRDDFTGRPDFSIGYGGVYPSNAGIIDAEGDIWQTNRKFCLRHLGEMGFGKKRFEEDIMREVLAFASEIGNGEKLDFDIHNLLANAVSNIVCVLVFGKRYEYGDPEFAEYLKALDNMSNLPIFQMSIPYGNRIPIIRRAFESFASNCKITDSIISKHLDEHKTSEGSGQQKDIIDIYLEAKKNESSVKQISNNVVFEDVHIKKTIWDLFAAGTETTTSTLRWCLVYMINFPDVQEKLRSEIHRVVGTARPPTLADKTAMPFTQAFIAEIQRIATLVPLAEFHKTTRDLELEGYAIPANTDVICNIAGVHMNEGNFPSPRTFRPERFIDDNGGFIKSLADLTIPFGIGKRVCLGEALARMELFLFLTALVQRFEFTAPAGKDRPSLVGTNKFVNVPLPFKLCVQPVV